MKLTLPTQAFGYIVLVWSVAHASLAADGAPTRFHDKLSVNYTDLPLAHVIRDIEDKGGVRLAVRAEDRVGYAPLVTYAAEEQTIGRILTRILLPRRLRLEPTGADTADIVARPDREEYRIQREEAFGFAHKPEVTRQGDNVTIRFETTGFCDVSIAVEDDRGRILRHLASGVLGMNAPEPFVWNSTRQTVVWDGKDDAGVYVDDKDACSVRVSLGLKPRLERTLYWAPEKRLMVLPPRLAACEEGVLLFEGMGVDKVLLFDRDGEYKRTIYPFPRDKVKSVEGLKWEKAVQSGMELPKRQGFQQATLLTSGDSAVLELGLKLHGGMAATAMAADGGRIVLAMNRINRLSRQGGNRTNIEA